MRGREMELTQSFRLGNGVEIEDDGTIYIGGRFTDLPGGDYGGDYVATCAPGGLHWATPCTSWALPCTYCGSINHQDYACTHCGGPTTQWWVKLRKMTGTRA